MAKEDYIIPVKIRLDQGRYKYGWVKTLTPDKNGEMRVLYPSGEYSTRSAEPIIHEPKGFNKLETSGIARGPQ